LKEGDRKDEVTKVNEEEISNEEEVIRRMMITTEEKSIRSSCAFQHLANLSFSHLH
jgi:hypothetical protein